MTNTMTMKLGALALGVLMMLPAHAAPVTQPDTGNYRIRFDWNTDVENQWLIVAPRAPAIIQGTERVARTGLANAQRRQADLRGSLLLGEVAAEGGVWARVGGSWGQQDDQDLKLGALRLPIRGLLPAPNPGDPLPEISDTEALADYAADQIDARLETQFRTLFTGQEWFDVLTPGEQDDAVANAAGNAVENWSYDEQLSHFNVGVDFISGNRADGAWILGGAIGYVRASQEFDDFKALNKGSKFDWDSVNLGAYASYVKGGVYADVALNYGWHSIDLKMPILNMVPAGSVIGTDGQTLALSLDTGWRFDLNDTLYLEPQVSAIWIQSDLEDAKVQRADALTHNGQFNTLHYGDPESRRFGAGLELGQDWKLSELTLTASLNAKYWLETQDERELTLSTPAKRYDTTIVNDPGVPTNDVKLPTIHVEEPSGYTQVTLATSLRNADRSLSGGLSLDYLTGGDFDSYGVTASLRYQW